MKALVTNETFNLRVYLMDIFVESTQNLCIRLILRLGTTLQKDGDLR